MNYKILNFNKKKFLKEDFKYYFKEFKNLEYLIEIDFLIFQENPIYFLEIFNLIFNNIYNFKDYLNYLFKIPINLNKIKNFKYNFEISLNILKFINILLINFFNELLNFKEIYFDILINFLNSSFLIIFLESLKILINNFNFNLKLNYFFKLYSILILKNEFKIQKIVLEIINKLILISKENCFILFEYNFFKIIFKLKNFFEDQILICNNLILIDNFFIKFLINESIILNFINNFFLFKFKNKKNLFKLINNLLKNDEIINNEKLIYLNFLNEEIFE